MWKQELKEIIDKANITLKHVKVRVRIQLFDLQRCKYSQLSLTYLIFYNIIFYKILFTINVPITVQAGYTEMIMDLWVIIMIKIIVIVKLTFIEARYSSKHFR